MTISLRPILVEDLDAFFTHQQHEPAQHMAAFVHEDPSNREHFDAHWSKLMKSDAILKRSIELDGLLVGHIMSFDMFGGDDQTREITYWIDHHHWGKGIATKALRQFLDIETTRPLYGRAAKDNTASIRSMEKCGFTIQAEERGFANARGEEIDEVVMVLGTGSDQIQQRKNVPVVISVLIGILTLPLFALYRAAEALNSIFVLASGLACVWSVYALFSSHGTSILAWILLPLSLVLIRLYFLIPFDSEQVYVSQLYRMADYFNQRLKNHPHSSKHDT